jgi:hypothetical protein
MIAVSAIKQGIMMVVIDAILKKMNASVEFILEKSCEVTQLFQENDVLDNKKIKIKQNYTSDIISHLFLMMILFIIRLFRQKYHHK